MKKVSFILFLSLLIACQKEVLPVINNGEDTSSVVVKKRIPICLCAEDTKAVANATTLKEDGFNVTMYHTELHDDYTSEYDRFLFENQKFVLTSGSQTDFKLEKNSNYYYWPSNYQLEEYGYSESYGMSICAVWPSSYKINDTGNGNGYFEPFIRVYADSVGNSQNLNLLQDPYFVTINDNNSVWGKWYQMDFFGTVGRLGMSLNSSYVEPDIWINFFWQDVNLKSSNLYLVTCTMKVDADNFPLSCNYLCIDDLDDSGWAEGDYYAEYFEGDSRSSGTVSFLFKPNNTKTYRTYPGMNGNLRPSGSTTLDSVVSNFEVRDLGARSMPSTDTERNALIKSVSKNTGLKDIIVASGNGLFPDNDLDSQGRLSLTFKHPLCCISNISAKLSSSDPAGITTKITELKLTAPSRGMLMFPNLGESYHGEYGDYYWTNDGNTTVINLLPLIQNGDGKMTVTTTESYPNEFSKVSLIPKANNLGSSSSYALTVAWTYYQNGASIGNYYQNKTVNLTSTKQTFVKLTIPSYTNKDKNVGVDNRQSTPTTEDL